MAKQVTINLTLATLKGRFFTGNSIYWGGGDDTAHTTHNASYTTTDSSFMYLDATYGTGSERSQMGRLLMNFDLSGLPTNAVVTSAILYCYISRITTNNAAIFPLTLAFYRVFTDPDYVNSTLRYAGNGTNPWARYGMVDGTDYTLSEQATAVIALSECPTYTIGAFNVPGGTGDISLLKTFDLTAMAKYAMATDSRQMKALFARSNASRRALTNLPNNGIADVGGNFDGEVAIWRDVTRQPTLVVTYIDALTHHPANDDGSIDTATIIDTSAGGAYLFDPVRIGTTGTARKFFVKNNLSSSVSLVNIYAQRSYGSKIPDMTRSTAGNGTISDITTTDQSANPTNYTTDERWRLIFTDATHFNVFRDNGTYDTPGATPTYSAGSPSTGTVGSLYTETNRNVSFTLTAGGTPFAASDQFDFRTYISDFHPSAPSDSESFLLIAPDNANLPGTFQPISWKPTIVTSNVSGGTVIPVADTTLFTAGMQVTFTARSNGSSLGTRTVSSISIGVSVTVDTGITLTSGDYIEGVRIGTSILIANGTYPYWLEPTAPASAVRQVKYPRWSARAI